MPTSDDESRELKERLSRAHENLLRARDDVQLVMHDVAELAPGMKTAVMGVIEGVFEKLVQAEREVEGASRTLETFREKVPESRRSTDGSISVRLFGLAGDEVHRRGSMAAQPLTVAWNGTSYYLQNSEPTLEGATRVFVYRATRPALRGSRIRVAESGRDRPSFRRPTRIVGSELLALRLFAEDIADIAERSPPRSGASRHQRERFAWRRATAVVRALFTPSTA